MGRPRKQPGPKLPEPAQQLVIRLLIAGERASKIREALHNAGYPSDLDDSAFTYYRRKPEVILGLRYARQEAFTTGYALRSVRVLRLSLHAEDLERRMYEIAAEADADEETGKRSILPYKLGAGLPPASKLKVAEIRFLNQAWLATQREISRLTDVDITPPVEAELERLITQYEQEHASRPDGRAIEQLQQELLRRFTRDMRAYVEKREAIAAEVLAQRADAAAHAAEEEAKASQPSQQAGAQKASQGAQSGR